MEQQGILRKVYGGAAVNVSLNSEPEYAIAKEAVKLIRPGDTIYMGVGTAVQATVQYMKNIGNITVLPMPCVSLWNSAKSRIAQRTAPAKELMLSGFPAAKNLTHFNVDKAFIGTSGITDFHIGETQLHKHMVLNARQSIALADSSKLGIRAMNNVCALDQSDLVITDSNQSVKVLQNTGGKVIVAK